MGAILEQLGINQSIFIQIAVFAVFFLIAGPLFFQPYLDLLERRYQRTVEDKKAAQEMMEKASAKLEEYKKILADERAAARKDFEILVAAVKREESAIVAAARAEARDLTQKARDAVQAESEALRGQLSIEVESMAQGLANQLLARKG